MREWESAIERKYGVNLSDAKFSRDLLIFSACVTQGVNLLNDRERE
jgi:hypothetical protein